MVFRYYRVPISITVNKIYIVICVEGAQNMFRRLLTYDLKKNEINNLNKTGNTPIIQYEPICWLNALISQGPLC